MKITIKNKIKNNQIRFNELRSGSTFYLLGDDVDNVMLKTSGNEPYTAIELPTGKSFRVTDDRVIPLDCDLDIINEG